MIFTLPKFHWPWSISSRSNKVTKVRSGPCFGTHWKLPWYLLETTAIMWESARNALKPTTITKIRTHDMLFVISWVKVIPGHSLMTSQYGTFSVMYTIIHHPPAVWRRTRVYFAPWHMTLNFLHFIWYVTLTLTYELDLIQGKPWVLHNMRATEPSHVTEVLSQSR